MLEETFGNDLQMSESEILYHKTSAKSFLRVLNHHIPAVIFTNYCWSGSCSFNCFSDKLEGVRLIFSDLAAILEHRTGSLGWGLDYCPQSPLAALLASLLSERSELGGLVSEFGFECRFATLTLKLLETSYFGAKMLRTRISTVVSIFFGL